MSVRLVRTPVAAFAALLVAAAHATPAAVRAQSGKGTLSSTVGGAALGLYSGATLGLVGSLLPCDRTLLGSRCAAAGAGVGGVVGLTMGGLLGARSEAHVRARLQSAGLGAAAGAVVGVGMRSAVRQYGWADAGAFAAIGGAIGAAPRGTLIGVGAGITLGGLAWVVSRRVGLPDVAMLFLVGGALGGLIDWVGAYADAEDGRGPAFTSTFSFELR